MGVPNVDISLLSVIVAAIVGMIIGALWYSPLILGNLWIKLLGISRRALNREKKKGMSRKYLITFISALIMAFILARFAVYATAQTFNDALQLAFWIWLGFIAPVTLGAVLWEGKPFKLWILNNSYHLVSLIIMAAILTAWR